MNVGMILGAPYPADIRVAKEADALIRAGYTVHLLCTNKGEQPAEEVVDGIHVRRVSGLAHLYQVGLWDVVNAVNFVHPLFYGAVRTFIRQRRIDVLHVHDLPLVKTVVRLGKRHRVPVVFDMHENFPEALSVWFAWKKNPVIRLKNKLFFGYERWENFERYAVRQSDRVIAVVEEMADRLVEKYHVSPEKITVVTNSEYRTFKDGERIPEVYGPDADRFIITYSGNVGPHRGVDTVIEGMQYLKDLPVQFAVVGRMNSAVQHTLEAMIIQYGLEDHVKLYGYQPFTAFPSFMAQAAVNVIPHHSNDHTNNTIPHKLYQCMQMQRPLLVSSSAPLKRVVEETSSGLVFEAGHARDMARQVRTLYEDAELRQRLAQNGYLATQEGPYHWEHTQEALLRLYQELSNR